MEPKTFEHQTAMYAIASSTNEAVVQDLEQQVRERRITEQERRQLEDDAFVEVLTHPLRERVHDFRRISFKETINWNQLQKAAQASTAAVLIGILTIAAGKGWIDYSNRQTAQNPTPEIPLKSRPTRDPSGNATPWLGERLQIERNLKP